MNIQILSKNKGSIVPRSEKLPGTKRFLPVNFIASLLAMMAFLPVTTVNGQTTLTYPSSTTWQCPFGVTSVTVECWGGGGAGGGATGNPAAGGGGAGGSYVKRNALAVTPGTIYTITVGTGATGGTGNGAAGNDSWFGSAATVMAKGGPGGARANSNNQTSAGATALTTGNVGFTAPFNYYGGGGGTGVALGISGGAGGSSAGTGSNGNPGLITVAGIAVTGGGAGVNGSASSADGADNTNLGGGGAGGRAGNATDRQGGNGGNGQVQITFTQPSCPISTAITPATTQTVCQGATAGTLTANITLSGTSGTPTLLYQWYYNTTNTNTVAGATLVGGATSQTYVPSTAAAGTRYYFCVGYATNNSCAQTNATQSLASTTVQVTVQQSLAGTYNVGAGQTYTTLTAAVAAYNNSCLAGPVTFRLTSATYSGSETFPIVINANATASATNTLTIVPNTGNTATISGSLNSNALIRILGSYVTIDGSNNGTNSRNLTITNTSTTGPSVLLVGSAGTTPITYVTVKNSNIINGINTASALVISDVTLGNAGYFNDITIQNNTIQKAFIGLYARAVNTGSNGSGLNILSNDLTASGVNAIRRVGIYVQDANGAYVNGNTVGNFETASTEFDYGIWFASGTKNSVISNNTISNLAYTGASNTGPSGIFISTNVPLSDLRISNNTISNITSTGVVAAYGAANGIYLDFASSGGDIYNNRISNIKNTHASGYGCNGIQLSATASDAAFNVYNNFISDIASNGSTASRSYDRNGHGIAITAGGGYHVYNNTIVMNTNQANSGYPSALNITSGVTAPASIDVQNNLLINTQTQAGEKYAIQCGAANTVFASIDYNDYFTNGTNLGYIGSNRTNIAAIQAGFGSNTNALNILPVFVSSTNFHIQTAPAVNEALNNSGTPVPIVASDVDSDLRNPLTPDMGADEFKGRGSWIGNTSTSWTTASNWFDNFIPVATTNIEIGNATYMPVISSSIQPANNIVIETYGMLTVSGTGNLQIGGRMYSNGTFDVSTGTIEMTGTVPQNIPAGIFQSNYIKNLVISNTDNVTGVTLDGPLDVYRSVSFGPGGRKLTTNDNLTFKSTITETASLGIMDVTNSITGNVTVERYIPQQPKAWYYLSTPTSGQSVNAAWQEGNSPLSTSNNPGFGTIITNNVAGTGFDIIGGLAPSMKTFDSTTRGWVGIANTTVPVYNRKGYMIFLRGNRTVTSTASPSTAVNLRTRGTLFTPANPPTVTNLNANTYESIGNPYASAVDLTQLGLSGGVQDVFYIWDPKVTTAPSAYGFGAYQTFTRNGATYDVTPGGGSYPSGTCKTLESGQAFMVRAPSAAGSVTFTESSKVPVDITVSRAAVPVTNVNQLRTNMYVMSANRPVLLDGNLVQFDENYTNALDMQDAEKLGNTGENLGIAKQGKLLAVERRNNIQSADTIFYNLGQLRVQQYQFEFIPRGIAREGLEAFLEDSYLQTRTVVNLRDTTRVMFNIVNIPGSYAANRFRMVFQAKKKATTQPGSTVFETGKNNNGIVDNTDAKQAMESNAGINVYPNPVTNKVIQLQFNKQPAGEYNLVLMYGNGMQQQLPAIQINEGQTSRTVSLPASIAPGVYRIQITGPNNSKTVKTITVL